MPPDKHFNVLEPSAQLKLVSEQSKSLFHGYCSRSSTVIFAEYSTLRSAQCLESEMFAVSHN